MNYHSSSSLNDSRRGALRRLLHQKNCISIIEAHNPLSAIVAETASVTDESGMKREFDGFWSSSLTDSMSRGVPDIEFLDIKSRLDNINEMFQVTSKPLVLDGDTGGRTEHFERHVKIVERAGVSAIVIEDKTGPKRNSLFGNEKVQILADVREFSEKISAGKAAQNTSDFMIIARLESLIVGNPLSEALDRAAAYVDAGADGIMIHSRQGTSDEVLEFARQFRASQPNLPLMCVPTSYAQSYAADLGAAGFNIVAYANHMLRAAYKAMEAVSEDILRYDRAAEVEGRCMEISRMLRLFPQ